MSGIRFYGTHVLTFFYVFYGYVIRVIAFVFWPMQSVEVSVCLRTHVKCVRN